MKTEDIFARLTEYRDEKNAAFQRKLIPTLGAERFLGARTPQIRSLAKEIYRSGEYADFLAALPHGFLDENLLHACIINEMRDYDECMKKTEEFLPYVDNWAVCDTLKPKVFGKNKNKLIGKALDWLDSELVYTVRFGIGMLMCFYLDADFSPEYPSRIAKIRSREYYVNMMSAWYFATALAKQWDEALPYLENGKLCEPVFSMTVRKALESYRIPDEKKAYLRTLKSSSTLNQTKRRSNEE